MLKIISYLNNSEQHLKKFSCWTELSRLFPINHYLPQSLKFFLLFFVLLFFIVIFLICSSMCTPHFQLQTYICLFIYLVIFSNIKKFTMLSTAMNDNWTNHTKPIMELKFQASGSEEMNIKMRMQKEEMKKNGLNKCCCWYSMVAIFLQKYYFAMVPMRMRKFNKLF